MARPNQPELPFEIGSRANLVFYRDAMPIVVEGTVCNLKPFQISTPNPSAGRLARMRRALIVRQENTQIWRVESEVVDAKPEGNCWICTFEPTKWAEIDRRRHPRFTVDLPVEVRLVTEVDGELQIVDHPGTALDLSLCGARVKMEAAIEPGSLVQLRVSLGTADIDVMAMTAFTKPYAGQQGFEIVDFVGNAQYVLHSYLVEKAA